jgi:hypothetical protein
MRFLLRWTKLGQHVHVSVFIGDGTGKLAGKLVFLEGEWAVFREVLAQTALATVVIEERR